MEPRWIDTRRGARRRASTSCATSRATRSTPSSTASAPTGPASRCPGRVAGRHRADRSARRRPRRRSARSSAGPACMVAHAADQDLAILERACGRGADAPVRHAGRGRLHRARHAVARGRSSNGCSASRLAKGDRLTDWTRRPLQRRAARVRGRRRRAPPRAARRARRAPRRRWAGCEWALDECEERRAARAHAGPSPRPRGGASRARASCAARRAVSRRQVGAWRERTRGRRSTCRRASCCPTSRSRASCSRPPRTREELSGDSRRRRPRCATARPKDLLAAVAAGLDARTGVELAAARVRSRRPLARAGGDRDRRVADAAGVGARPRSRRARDPRRPHPAPRRARRAGSATGWRAELVGEPIQRLLAGEAAIVLRDGGRRIELRDRVACRSLAWPRFKVGVQLHPQATTIDDLRAAWRAADALEVDSIWIWDHFYPALRRSRRRALRGATRCSRRWRSTRRTRTSARSSRATRTATRTCSPTWRARSTTSAAAASCSASARAGSSATTTEYGYEFGTARVAPARPRATTLPMHHGPARPARPAAARPAADPRRRLRARR